MSKIVAIYIFLIIFIAGFAIFSYSSYVDVFRFISFSPFIHYFLEFAVSILIIAIFFTASYLYTKNRDKRFAIIAGGFLIASFLNIYHLFSANEFPYDILTVYNIQKHPDLYYMLIEKLFISITLFITVYYSADVSQGKSKGFLIKIFAIYSGIFLLFIILQELIAPLYQDHYISRLLILEQTMELADEPFYFLTALLYSDILLSSRKRVFSLFTIGLIILGIGQLFYVNPNLVQGFGIIAHILKATGFFCVLIGIIKFKPSSNLPGFKQKVLTFLSLSLILVYLIFTAVSSAVFEIKFPEYSPFIFLEFFLFLAVILYIVVSNFIQPLTNVMNTIDQYNPEEEPVEIPVTTKDEIGSLTERLNSLMRTNWIYTQKLNQARQREELIRKIIASIRSKISINEIKHTLVEEVGKAFHADRCLIMEFNHTTNKYVPADEDSEYLSSPDIPSFINIDINQKKFLFLFKALEENNKENYLNNTQELLKNHKEVDLESKIILEELKIASFYTISLIYNGQIIGILTIHYSKSVELTEENRDFIKIIADQASIALTQIQLFEKAQQATVAKSDFLSSMSHELRTPLTSILGFTDLIKFQYFSNLPDKVKSFIDQISKNGSHLLYLVNDLLDLSKIEAGKLELTYSEFDTEKLINELAFALKPLADKKNLEIILELKNITINADPQRYKQIIYNLLSNSIKFTPDNGRIKIITDIDNGNIITSVEDNGIGIAPENYDRVFERFEQLKTDSHRVVPGTGLGLTISKKLVELHKGSIYFESELNKGSKFWFILPLKPDSEMQ